MANLNFNKIILGGRLTSAPELKQTQSGVPVCSFSIAVNRRAKAGEERVADFFNVTAWRATAEFVSKYFKKGQAILVCGELQTRSWTDNNGNKRNATEVVAGEVSFCEAKKESEGNYIPDAYKAPQTANFEAVDGDADLPF